MEFLVSIKILPLPREENSAKLYAAEALRARELADMGVIQRLWRVPGQKANWGLWEAQDATTLHKAISSLPLYPYMEVIVHPLAKHPSDPLKAPQSR
ncbi:MAG: muconolactone Delta-isomerase family protein [Opitutaceae bacterium]|nr:muconolactone Delta-isomerase family protein [Opitutaceae bacterium]